jgi:N-acetylneuraminate lyase
VNIETLRGILPAVVTPFDERGAFARGAFEALLDRVYGAGVNGIYICGTTGEGMLQSAQQRQAVAEAAVAATPADRVVVVHVGAGSVDEAKLLARHAEKTGAHAISSLPPMGASFSFRETKAWYEALAQATGLPLLVYYFPEINGSTASTAQLEELCEIPNVAGVKFTDFDLFKMSQVRRPGRRVFNGRDEVLAAGLLMGASGGIGTFYNLVPDLFVRIFESALHNRWEDARVAQDQANELIRITLRFPLFPAVKQILAWSGIDCGACLPPRAPLDGEQQAALRQQLAGSGFHSLSGD